MIFSVRVFFSPFGHQDHADVNAAKNILAAVHAVLACGEIVRPTPSKAVKAQFR